LKGQLAVFAMQLRSESETFILRHFKDLAPGATVAVCRLKGADGEAPCEAFLADQWALQLPVRLACRAGADRRRLLHAAIARFLKRHRVGYVLGEYLDQFVDFVPMLDAMGVPYVVQGHGLDLSSSIKNGSVGDSYLAYRSARAVLTRCEFHRQRLISMGLVADNIHVNPGGVDIPASIPQRPPAASKRFLAIGRMVPQKAPILLLEAFRLAASEDPDLTLDFVGGGALFPAVREFVEGCGLRDRVRLHGMAPEAEKHRLLADCGVFVQHSATDPETGDEEGLPAAIQEAMANGLAVVSTRHSGIPEAVIEGETGLLCNEGDVRAMAAAFLAAPARAAALGAAGYRRAAANYGWEHERARLRGWLFGEAAVA
jgi:colanic acid/amylovoran biosynthesis glycosyltransferase